LTGDRSAVRSRHRPPVAALGGAAGPSALELGSIFGGPQWLQLSHDKWAIRGAPSDAADTLKLYDLHLVPSAGEGQMEIKLVARLQNAKEPTTTREAFWRQVTNRVAGFAMGGRGDAIQIGRRPSSRAATPSRGLLSPESGERRVFERFPKRLEARFKAIIGQRRQPLLVFAVWRSRFGRPPVLPDK